MHFLPSRGREVSYFDRLMDFSSFLFLTTAPFLYFSYIYTHTHMTEIKHSDFQKKEEKENRRKPR